jgi:DNA polymerase III epsilon subunit-like protein
MKIIFIDTEVSGLRAYDQVIDFSAICLNKKILINTMVSGAESILPDQESLTGINFPQYTAQSKDASADIIKLTATSNLWVSFGLQFDMNWINQTLEMNHGDHMPNITGLCLLEIIRSILGHGLTLDRAIDRFVLNSSQKINILVNNLTVSRHRALFDAHLHRLLFIALMNLDKDAVLAHTKIFVAENT